jgi:hypothetical protein
MQPSPCTVDTSAGHASGPRGWAQRSILGIRRSDDISTEERLNRT